MNELENKKAVIIGCSGGIGNACAKLFLEEGAKVCGSYRNKNNNIENLSKYENFSYCELDLLKQNEISSKIKSAIKTLGGIDILINAAGISKPSMIFASNVSDWENIIQSNLISSFITVQNAVLPMIINKGGSIINISSVFGIRGGLGQSGYCASKAGLIGLTKAAALELAGKNIRVNTVAPGYIKTDMTSEFNTKQYEKCINDIPMRRFGEPDEVAQLCLFLASDKSKYITGQTFVIDGGLSI